MITSNQLTPTTESLVDSPTVIFLHIPKTAGTTFHSLLSWQYRNQPSCWLQGHDVKGLGFDRLSDSERRSLRLLRGHMHFGIHEQLPRPATYITFVREPVSRIVSYWRNAQQEAERRKNSSHWWLQAVSTQSLEEFIASGRDAEMENGQVRRIAGIKDRPGPCTRDDLDRAMANLNEFFSLVGHPRRFDESLVLGARRLGWNWPLLYQKGKVSRIRSGDLGFDDATQTAIRQANQLDETLYRHVQSRLEREIKKEGPTFEREVRQLRLTNRLCQPLLPLARICLRSVRQGLAIALRRSKTD